MSSELEGYRKGFRDGYREAQKDLSLSEMGETLVRGREMQGVKPKRKRTQSPKQKLLTLMTAKKWKTYSKGSGRKTYVEIRSQVSRSKAYKSKAKKL
jgi:hypothetical protein|tara:strand:- start:489 stop:779 length:291 start_codon:yes stop_codon:yes gene_type:complete